MADDPRRPEAEHAPIAGPPLEYRAAGADGPGVRVGQVIGGAAVSLLLGVVAVFVGILSALGRNVPTTSSDTGFFVVIGIATLLINGWAFLAYRSPRYRGFGIGLWIGFGLTLLMDGVCFGLGALR